MSGILRIINFEIERSQNLKVLGDWYDVQRDMLPFDIQMQIAEDHLTAIRENGEAYSEVLKRLRTI